MEHLFHFPAGFSDATTWVLLGLVLFLAMLAYLGVPKTITGALDKRAQTIQDELNAATKLREEAQELLASYQRRQREAEETASAIIAQAKADSERMVEATRAELAAKLVRRRELAEAKIAQAESDAINQVKAHAADLAAQAARRLMEDGVDAAAADALFDASLKDLRAKLS